MKKIIFLLLFSFIVPYLYADSSCRQYPWRWGRKAPEPVQCYCNCERYAQARGKCIQCNHIRVPKDFKISSTNS